MVFARACALIGLIGVALVVTGSIGSWATLDSSSSDLPGGSSVGGLDKDGWVTLVLAVLAAVPLAAIFAPLRVARVARWFPLPFGVLILLVALIDIADLISTSSEFTDQFSDAVFTLSIGWGLWLVLAGSIAISVPAVFLMFAPMPVAAHQTPPVPGAYVPGSVAPPGWLPQNSQPSPYPPHPQQGPPQPYLPHPYPPQPHQGQPFPYPPQPNQGPPPPAPAPPAWPTTGPSYPGSTGTGTDAGSSD